VGRDAVAVRRDLVARHSLSARPVPVHLLLPALELPAV